jgi:hypothetical protein
VSGRPFDADAHRDHMAEVLELMLPPEWRQPVADNLAVTARMAALVLSFPLDDHVEPAPVFEA